MIKPIKLWPDPILLEPTVNWEIGKSQFNLDEIEKDLIDTLIHTRAYGLAANQIGYKLRVMAINTQDDGQIRIMYNPIILSTSSDKQDAAEGCLSFPKIRLKIARSSSVEVKWQDKLNYTHSRIFKDIDARCILHEIDHLDGKVFKDYVSNLKFNYAQKMAK
jgi:peptide deformylase